MGKKNTVLRTTTFITQKSLISTIEDNYS